MPTKTKVKFLGSLNDDDSEVMLRMSVFESLLKDHSNNERSTKLF